MKRILLLVGGVLLLLLGGIGILIPILPTTPFVILAGICFSFASPKAYAWLRKSKFFGPYIDHYKNKVGVDRAAKVRGIVAVWVLLLFSAFMMRKTWSSIAFPLIASAVTIHLLLLKSKPKEEAGMVEQKQ